MAKDLPYFKFFCSEWNDGDICLEDYEVRGLFICLCSYYWSNECNLKFKKAEKKFKDAPEDLWKTLIDSDIIKEIEGSLCISFLDEQWEEREATSKKNSEAGKASAEARRLKKEHKANEDSTKNQRSLNSGSTETQPLREEKRREEEKREEERKEKEFNIFWNLYPTKKAKKNCLAKWNKLKDKDIEKILRTVKNYVAYKPFKDYTHPNPMTYLNQERWNDEIKVNGKVVKSDEELKDLVTFYWKHEGRSNKRTIAKDKAEAYFKKQAVGGYIAVVL